jgi:hypothetical protein
LEFNAKGHHGKFFLFRHEQMQKNYGEDLEKVKRAIKECDPEGKFSNAFTDELFGFT